jgi:hypothetical protein
MDYAKEEALKSKEIEQSRLREQKLADWTCGNVFLKSETAGSRLLAHLARCPVAQFIYSSQGCPAFAAYRRAVAQMLELELKSCRWYGEHQCRPFFDEIGNRLTSLDTPHGAHMRRA